MRPTVTILLMLARLLGALQLVVGLAMWFGALPNAVAVHTMTGSLFVLVLWIVAVIALFSLSSRGVPLVALLWGGLVLWLGMAQTTLLVGAAHWAVRLAHLLVGVAAIGLSESLAKAVRSHWAARGAAAALIVCAIGAGSARAQPPACAESPREPLTMIDVPGSPFQALPTADGCWVFASLPRTTLAFPAGIAVLRREHGTLTLARVERVGGNPTGMAITHDGRTLIVAAGARIAFLSVAKLEAGERDAVLGYLDEPGTIGRIYASATRDDRFVFVADERAQTITVVDLAKAFATKFSASAIVGKIPTGMLPISVTLSSDDKIMYATSERASPAMRWPAECKREGAAADTTPVSPQGAIHVVDVDRARTDPAHAVLASVPAGCSAVRLVLSPDGERAYVTARNSDALMVFDTRALRNDPTHALVARVPVGTAPVGVAVVDSGRKVIVTNSNRFAGSANDRQTLTVVDASRVRGGAAAIMGSIPAGAFPREMRVTADGRALIVTNFASSQIELIDLARLPVEPVKR